VAPIITSYQRLGSSTDISATTFPPRLYSVSLQGAAMLLPGKEIASKVDFGGELGRRSAGTTSFDETLSNTECQSIGIEQKRMEQDGLFGGETDLPKAPPRSGLAFRVALLVDSKSARFAALDARSNLRRA
jgi:hypothetical protein